MDGYKVVLILTMVIFVSEVDSQKTGSLIGNFCPSGWKMVYLADGKNSSTSKICIKSFTDVQVTWPQAQATCRKNIGRLIDMENTIYMSQNTNINDKFNLNTTEFWSGIYRQDKHVLIQDGFPPVKAEDKHLRFLSWESGEPRESEEKCVAIKSNDALNRTSYIFKAFMTSCNRNLSFYCFTDSFNTISEVSTCPEGYVGSLQWKYCYKAHNTLGTYWAGAASCNKDGDVIAVIDPNANSDALIEGAGAMFSDFLHREVTYYVDKQRNGCHVMTYNRNSRPGFVSDVLCDVRAGFICQRKRITPITQEEITLNIRSVYTSQAKLREVEWFSEKPITCSLSRPLTDLELVVFTQDSVPLGAPYTGNMNKFRNVSSISVPKAEPYLSVGEYACKVVHKALPNIVISKNTVYVRFVEKKYLIYRGSIDAIPPMKGADNFLKFNYGLTGYSSEVFTITSSLQETLKRALYSVRMDPDSALHISSTQQSVDRISNNGSTIEFSFLVTLRKNIDWHLSEMFTDTNDRWLVEEVTRAINYSKRQTKRFDFKTLNIRSTVSCPYLEIYNAEVDKTLIFWMKPGQNRTVQSTDNCLTDRRPLAEATCTGSMSKGYSLTNIKINQKCVFTAAVNSSVTALLQTLLNEDVNEWNIGAIISDTANLTAADDLISRDVIYTAEILDNVAELPTINAQDFDKVVSVVDNIIRLSEDVLVDAQNTGSATNTILKALETVASKLDLLPGMSKTIVKPSFAIEVSDISRISNSVIGLQLDASGNSAIDKHDLQTLSKEGEATSGETSAAIILPADIMKANNITKLHMQIYASTKLFIQKKGHTRYILNGKVVAATINRDDGQAITNLGNASVKAIFKPIKDSDKHVCAFWDYTLYDAAGGWSTQGCELQEINSGRVICVCDHLTNFAILIDLGDTPIDPRHDQALSIISIIGLILSIIGLSLTVLSFFVLRQLRKGNAQKTLFNLALAMLISWIVFLAGIKQTSSYGGCIAVAAILHYLILVTFMWMLVEGLLQYLRFVKVLGTYIPRFILKATIFAWGLPILPVVIVLGIDYELYWGGKSYCWMSLTPLYYAFALPVGLIILTNIIVFGLIIYNLVNRPKGLQTNQSEYKRMMINFWGALSGFVLLGITWILGFFAISDARIVFLYPFTILNVLQGLFIFLIFTFREPQIRSYLRNKLRRKKTAKYVLDSSSASKTNQNSAQSTALLGLASINNDSTSS